MLFPSRRSPVKSRRPRSAVALLALTLVVTAATCRSASAGTFYSFQNITNNGGPDVAGQLKAEVIDIGTNGGTTPYQVAFKFTNSGPTASSITDIFFADGTLLGMASVPTTAGVSFSQYASPGNLPGGNTLSPAFVTSAGFSADSDPPAQPNGVNPGEELTIIFNLINGQTYADTIKALNNPAGYKDEKGVDRDGLRIGLHIQGLPQGQSDSYVNIPNDDEDITEIPEPASLALAGIGIAGMAGYGWRRRRRGGRGQVIHQRIFEPALVPAKASRSWSFE